MPKTSYPHIRKALSLRMRLHCGGEEGQALLEFAYCLPVLLLLVFAIFMFGLVLNNYLVLTNAVTIGAQQLALDRGQSTDPCADTVTAMNAAAPSLNLSQNATFSFVLNGTSYPGTSCTTAPSNLIQGASAQVTVTYPCNLTVLGTNYASAPACKLTAQTTEYVQ